MTESVGIQSGESAEFFLLVDDESPLDLTYKANIQNSGIASVQVDSDGMLLVMGLSSGNTDLSVTVLDSADLADTFMIGIVVDR